MKRNLKAAEQENAKVVFAEIGDKGALASSSIAALDATRFPHKSPFSTTMPSFDHFEQNAHTCPLIYYPYDWILNLTREPSPWKGRKRRDKNTLSPPPSSHLVQRSPPLLPTPCCPTPHPPPALSAPLHGRRWEPKWWCFSGGDNCRTHPPPRL